MQCLTILELKECKSCVLFLDLIYIHSDLTTSTLTANSGTDLQWGVVAPEDIQDQIQFHTDTGSFTWYDPIASFQDYDFTVSALNAEGYSYPYDFRVSIYPGYFVTVSTNASAVQAGSPVKIYGKTIDFEGVPVSNANVTVTIAYSGFGDRALLSSVVTSDSNGDWNMIWTPLASDTGVFGIGLTFVDFLKKLPIIF